MSRKHRGRATGDAVTYQTPLPAGGVQLETFLPWKLVQRGFKKEVITPLDAPQAFVEEARRERRLREATRDTPLMRALGLAYHWQRLLDEGKFGSMTEIAAAEDIDLGQASRIYWLAQLAPDLAEGRLDVSLTSLLRGRFTPYWQGQRGELDASLRCRTPCRPAAARRFFSPIASPVACGHQTKTATGGPQTCVNP